MKCVIGITAALVGALGDTELRAQQVPEPVRPAMIISDPPARALPAPSARSVPAPLGWPRGFPMTVQVNTDTAGLNIIGDAGNEPSLAIDPTAPLRMAVGWRQFDSVTSNFRQAGYAASDDGGRTWRYRGVIEPGVFRSDPVLRANRHGVFLFNSLMSNLMTQIFRSTDGGATWGNPVQSLAGDKTWMAIDTTDGIGADNIYQTWNSGGFSRSSDDGMTFQFRGVPLSFGGTIAIGSDGTVFVCDPANRVAFSNNARDPDSMYFFGTGQVNLGSVPFNRAPNPGGLLTQGWIDVDRSNGPRHGWVYYCSVAITRGDPSDLRIARSEDGGVTWMPAVTINNDPAGPNRWQWFATMSVAPNGRIDVVWNDTRASNLNNVSETYYAYSLDGGSTWLDQRPIGPAWNSHHGWPNQNKIGDYYDIHSDNVGVDLIYAATYNFNPDRNQGEQDVYYVRIGEHDCNRNSIGDETEIAAEPGLDCDQSGIPDSCEIAAGTLRDIDRNGVPDKCECFADWNGDGVVNSADFFAFAEAFYAGNTDLNRDGLINSQDFFDYLTAYFFGCR